MAAGEMFDKRLAIVTGATSVIGGAIAEDLANHGAFVVGTTSDTDRAREFTKKMQGQGVGEVLDLRQREAITPFLSGIAVKSKLVPSLLVNGYGHSVNKPAVGLRPEDMDEEIVANFSGPFELTRQVLRQLGKDIEAGKAPEGSAVFIGSPVAGGRGGQLAYAAPKAAIRAAVPTLAQEYASRGIRVNGVEPGIVMSRMTSRETIGNENVDAIIGATALGRAGTGQEIANAVRFLLSPEASFVTGAILAVDGGVAL